jgi:hypothetical protein
MRKFDEHLTDFVIVLMTEQEQRRQAFEGSREEFENSPTELVVASALRQLGREYGSVVLRSINRPT